MFISYLLGAKDTTVNKTHSLLPRSSLSPEGTICTQGEWSGDRPSRRRRGRSQGRNECSVSQEGIDREHSRLKGRGTAGFCRQDHAGGSVEGVLRGWAWCRGLDQGGDRLHLLGCFPEAPLQPCMCGSSTPSWNRSLCLPPRPDEAAGFCSGDLLIEKYVFFKHENSHRHGEMFRP